MKNYILPVAVGLAAGGLYYLVFPHNNIFFVITATTVPALITGFLARSSQKVNQDAVKNFVPVQLSSVFIFNTLHNVSALLHTDVQRANRVVELLAELIRAINDMERHEFNLFAREVKCADIFLKIEKSRLSGRFDFKLDIEKNSLEVPVPRFLLLPLVEHAITSGVEKFEPPVSIIIAAKCEQNFLIVEISDLSNIMSENEPNFKPFVQAFKKRLAKYDLHADFFLESLAPAGTRRILRLPLRHDVKSAWRQS
ncbi:histidine kinase [candidate division KSB1 bacterium]|nr:histidine kinase [candidate division KSB1 bacterium]